MIMQGSRVIFETFNDGLCSLREIDDDGNPGIEKECLRYQERTVGVKRHYEAMTAKVQVDRLIRVPFRPWLTSEYLAVIGGETYEVGQVQMIPDTWPKCNDISLQLIRQRRI